MARQVRKRYLREAILKTEELLLSFANEAMVRVCLERSLEAASKPYCIVVYLPFGDTFEGSARLIDNYDTEEAAAAAYEATIRNLRNGQKVKAKSSATLTLCGKVRTVG